MPPNRIERLDFWLEIKSVKLFQLEELHVTSLVTDVQQHVCSHHQTTTATWRHVALAR